MNNVNTKGFKSDDDGEIMIDGSTCALEGTYRNGTYVPTNNSIGWTGASPLFGGRLNGDCDSNVCDEKTYFYKGHDSSDVIKYIVDLGIV